MGTLGPERYGADFPHSGCSLSAPRDEHISAATRRVSTDARGSRQDQCEGMSTPPQAARGESFAYAESLYGYAAGRLNPFSLRCWLIQRLMLDLGLEHGCAEEAVEHVLDVNRRAEPARSVHDLERQRRREPTRALWRTAHGRAGRRLRLRRASDSACRAADSIDACAAGTPELLAAP